MPKTKNNEVYDVCGGFYLFVLKIPVRDETVCGTNRDPQEVFQGTASCFLMLEEVQAPCLITLENAFELCTSRRPEPGTLRVLFGLFFLGRFIQANTCAMNKIHLL